MSDQRQTTHSSQAIIFDLYETLITEYDPNWELTPSTAQRLGVDEREFSGEWRKIQSKRLSGQIADFPTALRQCCQNLESLPDDKTLNQLLEERLEAKRQPLLQLDQRIVEMLHRLSQLDVKIGLLSNAAPEEMAAWSGSMLATLVDEAVFSCDVGLVKPDVEIYHVMCRRLNAAARETIFVGDGRFDELTGAANAGLTPYWATWFLDQWPSWKRSDEARARAARFPRLQEPLDVLSLLKN